MDESLKISRILHVRDALSLVVSALMSSMEKKKVENFEISWLRIFFPLTLMGPSSDPGLMEKHFKQGF